MVSLATALGIRILVTAYKEVQAECVANGIHYVTIINQLCKWGFGIKIWWG
jgi:hypothetical protein